MGEKLQDKAGRFPYKNIVFDMGKVLVDYDPDRVTRQYTQDESRVREIHNTLFCSGEWIMLDAGLISEAYALRKLLRRFESEEMREIARQSFAHWHEVNMTPKPGMEALLRELKARGHGLYVLSNASRRLPQCYREVIPAAECFDGVFFSADWGCMKPQDVMYERFFAHFGLKPESCFFIDDLDINIEGARACGMAGYVFEHGEVGRLREVLGLPRMSGEAQALEQARVSEQAQAQEQERASGGGE